MGEFIIMVFEINIQCIFTQLSLKHTLCLKPNPNIAMFPPSLATVMSSHQVWVCSRQRGCLGARTDWHRR